MNRVRLPGLDPNMVAAVEPPRPPPPQAPPPILGRGGDCEAATVAIDWPMYQETRVYTTARRWRACDVSVSIPENLAYTAIGFTVSICIYAISQGTRTLVATGRSRFDLSAGAPDAARYFPVKWTAAARTVGERYEVTASVDTQRVPAIAVIPGKLTITIAASDEMTDPPDAVGEWSMLVAGAATSQIVIQPVGFTIPPRLEVMAVQAVNTVAFQRYLFLFDTTAFTAGTAPFGAAVKVWPLGAAAGSGAFESNIRYRCRFSPILAISTTANVFTQAVDGTLAMTVR